MINGMLKWYSKLVRKCQVISTGKLSPYRCPMCLANTVLVKMHQVFEFNKLSYPNFGGMFWLTPTGHNTNHIYQQISVNVISYVMHADRYTWVQVKY